jgi:hypothetical protein
VQQAIDFAEAARATMRHWPPRALAMVGAMQACAHAPARDSRRSQQAQDDAAVALASTDCGDPEPDWLDFDEADYWVTSPAPTATSANAKG